MDIGVGAKKRALQPLNKSIAAERCVTKTVLQTVTSEQSSVPPSFGRQQLFQLFLQLR